MLGDKRFIRSLRIKNLLSFGDQGMEIDLQSLNVMIGVNGSGKSNLIETIKILKETPRDIANPIREGGGISDWLWKGSKNTPTAEIDATIEYPDGIMPLRYVVRFTMSGQRFELVDERVENEKRIRDEKDVYFFYRYQNNVPYLNVRTQITDLAGSNKGRTPRSLHREEINPDQSILSQRKDPDQYPEITYLNDRFSKIRLYQDWRFGRSAPPRLPQRPDTPEDFLDENDASNLCLVINTLQNKPEIKKLLLEKLQLIYEFVEDITIKIQGGTVQLHLHEKGAQESIPAIRLSDGILRYLCLLSVLCHPSPPPLVCIEEPEIGLHPDAIPSVAELLIEASHRTQLIVTTHSDILVSALSEVPESVLVCERDDEGTRFRRLEKKPLKEWLENYSMGELWSKGEIGGNRW